MQCDAKINFGQTQVENLYELLPNRMYSPPVPCPFQGCSLIASSWAKVAQLCNFKASPLTLLDFGSESQLIRTKTFQLSNRPHSNKGGCDIFCMLIQPYNLISRVRENRICYFEFCLAEPWQSRIMAKRWPTHGQATAEP